MPTYITAAIIVLLGYIVIPVAAGMWVGKRIRLPETYPTIRRYMRGAFLVVCIFLLIYTLIGLFIAEDQGFSVPVTLALMAGLCVLIGIPGELFLLMVRRGEKKQQI